ncbi:6-phosphogluconolactonase [Janibacter alittae]|uniref:6-phosphogluconolactonase n=1 Tax=Janibacter alittae TaxID=3115209 RepID=A0ABZ2MDA0_9MICO
MTAPLLVIHPGPSRLITLAGGRLLTAVQDAVAARGEAHVALTGGSMGSAVVAALTDHPAGDVVDWSCVHFWWGDERYLPAGDPDRNDTQSDDAGLRTLTATAETVHRVLGPDEADSAEDAARRYEEELRTHGNGAFDVVLLGVGPDGHVASLFPGHPKQQDTSGIAVAVHDSPKPPPTRVTLTAECLSRSRQVWFIVSGQDKAEAVAKGVAGAPAEESSTGLVRGQERTVWLVDEAAASGVGQVSG